MDGDHARFDIQCATGLKVQEITRATHIVAARMMWGSLKLEDIVCIILIIFYTSSILFDEELDGACYSYRYRRASSDWGTEFSTNDIACLHLIAEIIYLEAWYPKTGEDHSARDKRVTIIHKSDSVVTRLQFLDCLCRHYTYTLSPVHSHSFNTRPHATPLTIHHTNAQK